MRRKSPAEVELIRQSARWCEHAHRLLQQYSVPGATEAEASLRAGYEATLAMLEALGPEYAGQLGSQDGATAGYRGQIGRRSAWAHAVAHNITFREGDMLVTETAAPVWGYNAELERGMVVGTPTDEQRRLHEHVVAAQQVAFDAFRPGVTCADVDRAVLDYFDAERPPRRSGASTPATRSASATTRRRSSTSATTRRSSRGWCSRSSRASTRRGSAASGTPTPSSSPTTASRSSPTTRATSRA